MAATATMQSITPPNAMQLYQLLAHLDDADKQATISSPLPSPKSPHPRIHVAQLLRAFCAGADVNGLPDTPHLTDTLRLIRQHCVSDPNYRELVDRICSSYPSLRRIQSAFELNEDGSKSADAAGWPGFFEVLRMEAQDAPGHDEIHQAMEVYLDNAVNESCRYRVWRVVLEEQVTAELGIPRDQLAALHAALQHDNRAHYAILHALRCAYARNLPWSEVVEQVGGLVRLSKPGTWENVRATLQAMTPYVTRGTSHTTDLSSFYEDDMRSMEADDSFIPVDDFDDEIEHGYDMEEEDMSGMYEDVDVYTSDQYDPDAYLYEGSGRYQDSPELDVYMLNKYGVPSMTPEPYIERTNTPEERVLETMMEELSVTENNE